ncbi:ATP synthase subunit I [Desulfatirhabdium butyrativorans]|uniref:ATP synthase subunit I n=1 Tax=Desulfatirhabdium butyrativorans TaxID=340467 RepID=UPI0004256613|nr:ATP synthase subunit I [Desulfatirhabdium butyrativorans]
MTASIRELQKQYGSRAMILAIAAGLVLILAGRGAWGRGLILGTLFSVINFVLMAQALPKTIAATRKRSTLLSFGSVGLRYLILAVPILIAFKSSRFEIFGVCIGLFMVQIVMLGERLYQRFHRRLS